MSKRVLLFDLGGVLADLARPTEAMELPMTDKEFWAIWLKSSNVYAFETGKISVQDFCQRFGRELADVDCVFSEKRFRQWTICLFPSAEELLRMLAKDHSLVLLSNTNIVHWQQIESSTQIFSRFDHTFLSYKTGLYKPSLGSFQGVLHALNRSPMDMLYFDDTPRNVQAAEGIGLKSHVAKGIEQIEDVLTRELLC